jgi:hypothetical protein
MSVADKIIGILAGVAIALFFVNNVHYYFKNVLGIGKKG